MSINPTHEKWTPEQFEEVVQDLLEEPEELEPAPEPVQNRTLADIYRKTVYNPHAIDELSSDDDDQFGHYYPLYFEDIMKENPS